MQWYWFGIVYLALDMGLSVGSGHKDQALPGVQAVCLGGAFLHGSSVCMSCAALIAAFLLQGNSGLCPPRAAPAKDVKCPGEHAAGAGHAHHHQVSPSLPWGFHLCSSQQDHCLGSHYKAWSESSDPLPSGLQMQAFPWSRTAEQGCFQLTDKFLVTDFVCPGVTSKPQAGFFL